ncbi:hypothetical protein EI94DRAFT_1836223 [Lactarius quietus]|nr:hypothetical protein EI94DRAFT_1836223 [Lactarius quietus]
MHEPELLSDEATTGRSKAFDAASNLHGVDLVLLATPSHTGKPHPSAISSLYQQTDIVGIRSAFAGLCLAAHAGRVAAAVDPLRPAATHARKSSVMRWTLLSVVFPSGLRSLYELREMRWIEARHTLDKEKEKALLLSEVLSVGVVRNLIDSALWAARAIDSYFELPYYLRIFSLVMYFYASPRITVASDSESKSFASR